MFPGGTYLADLKVWSLLCSLCSLWAGYRTVLIRGCGAFKGTWGDEQGAPEVTSLVRWGQKMTCPLVFVHLPFPGITCFSLSLLIFAAVIREVQSTQVCSAADKTDWAQELFQLRAYQHH